MRAPDLTIVNIPVWAFPHFTMLAARETTGPAAAVLERRPAVPRHGRDARRGRRARPDRTRLRPRLGRHRRRGRRWPESRRSRAAPRLLASLRGSTFGRIGGRPMGMYTAVSNPDQWMRQFGVDVEEIDQWELVRRAEAVDRGARARRARMARARTPRACTTTASASRPSCSSARSARYHAMRELIERVEPRLLRHQGPARADRPLLHDGRHRGVPQRPVRLGRARRSRIVCSTEADMDAALTMQILKRLSGTPVLFADVRHYHADLGVWDLCNSGQHATWFAARSDDPAENLAPRPPLPGGLLLPGRRRLASTTSPRPATSRSRGSPGSTAATGCTSCAARSSASTTRRTSALMRASTYVWPHAFARFDAAADEILGRYGSNHIHAVPGDHVETLRDVCRLLGHRLRRLRRRPCDGAPARHRHRHVRRARPSSRRPTATVVASAARGTRLAAAAGVGRARRRGRLVGRRRRALPRAAAPGGRPASRRSASAASGRASLPCDADGRPLRPAILYGIDTRASAEIAELTATLGADAILRARRLGALEPGARAEAAVAAAARARRLGGDGALAHGQLVRRRAADRRVGARPPLREPVRPALRPRRRDAGTRLGGARSFRACRCRGSSGRPRSPARCMPTPRRGDGHPRGYARRAPAPSTPGPRRVSVGVRGPGELMLHVRLDDVPRVGRGGAVGSPELWTTCGVDSGLLIARGGPRDRRDPDDLDPRSHRGARTSQLGAEAAAARRRAPTAWSCCRTSRASARPSSIPTPAGRSAA